MRQVEVSSISEQFGGQAANRVAALYQTPDIVGQRQAVLERLALRTGERVLDVGSGPGLLVQSMAEQVGPAGAVMGVDLSESMVAIAREHCRQQPWVRFEVSEATSLPYADAEFDVVVCTQVLEYVPNVQHAIHELARVLRPGGRFLVMDTDWESCVWSTEDTTRMRTMLAEWDRHCAHPQLPRSLKERLARGCLSVEEIGVVAIINTEFDHDTYSYGISEGIAKFVRKGGRIAPEYVDAWVQELTDEKRTQPYFFSLNRYVFSGRRSQ